MLDLYLMFVYISLLLRLDREVSYDGFSSTAQEKYKRFLERRLNHFN